MDIAMIQNTLFSTLITGTPLLIIGLGELVCERSGVLNLGQEGMMLMGAMAGFAGAHLTGSLTAGIVFAMVAGMLMSLIFGFLTLTLSTNQVATGLALTIFGTGLSAFLGNSLVGQTVEGFKVLPIPLLSHIPFIGPVVFSHDLLFYLSLVLVVMAWYVLHKTRLGLTIRAVGENPHSANALGINVITLRYGTVLFGGAMAGLAGAYMSLATTSMWAEGMTAGRGWIALALVVFASWRIGYLVLGAYLFGFMSIMHLVLQGLHISFPHVIIELLPILRKIQNTDLSIPPNLLAMLPYLATIIVMVLLNSNSIRQKLSTPMSLGKPFDPKVH